MVHQKGDRAEDSNVCLHIFIPYQLNSISLNAGNMLAQGLGGLVAAGILSGMEGVRGIRGWRWVSGSSPFCSCSTLGSFILLKAVSQSHLGS